MLALADGTRTAAQIAAELGIAPRQPLAHLHVLRKEFGITWKIEDGKLRAVYPKGKGIDDFVGEPSRSPPPMRSRSLHPSPSPMPRAWPWRKPPRCARDARRASRSRRSPPGPGYPLTASAKSSARLSLPTDPRSGRPRRGKCQPRSLAASRSWCSSPLQSYRYFLHGRRGWSGSCWSFVVRSPATP